MCQVCQKEWEFVWTHVKWLDTFFVNKWSLVWFLRFSEVMCFVSVHRNVEGLCLPCLLILLIHICKMSVKCKKKLTKTFVVVVLRAWKTFTHLFKGTPDVFSIRELSKMSATQKIQRRTLVPDLKPLKDLQNRIEALFYSSSSGLMSC